MAIFIKNSLKEKWLSEQNGKCLSYDFGRVKTYNILLLQVRIGNRFHIRQMFAFPPTPNP